MASPLPALRAKDDALSNAARFEALVSLHGSAVTFHREEPASPLRCPCLSPEGYRSPAWHIANPMAPVCNEEGYLPADTIATNLVCKAFVQPVQSRSVRSQVNEQIIGMFPGEVLSDDHIGIFPLSWAGQSLNFNDWNDAGADFVIYDAKRFTVVSVNKIPDPSDGAPHHWEVGLRMIKDERPL